MKLTFLICLFAVLQSFAIKTFSQNQRLSINEKNISIENIIQLIEEKTDLYFMYSTKTVDVKRTVDIDATNKLVAEILDDIFKGTDVFYKIEGRLIALSKNGEVSPTTQQQKAVSGKVTDSAGSPLPGVAVLVKGTSKGVITDIDGKYTLTNVPANAVLQFSFVGMKSREITVAGKATVNVAMIEETVGLDEVVAVGYGTQKKVNLTGAVSSIKGEIMTKRPVVNASTMLQGLVPGLQVVQGSGQPGSENTTFRIRGQGTYSSAGSDPLILINGVPGNIDNIDPNIIESVSVLKDAASASIYGARAANGVILVTTKKGSSKPNTINATYSSVFSINVPTRMPEIVTNSADYMNYFNLAKQNSSKPGIYSPELIDLYKKNAGSDLYPNFDWLDYMFNPTVVQSHNLNVNGASEKSEYNISLSYIDQPGTMRGFNFKKYNFSVNLTSNVTNWMKIGTYFSAKYGDRKEPRNGPVDSFLAAMSQAPTYKPWLPDDGSGVKKYTMLAYDGIEENNKNMVAVVDNGIATTHRDFDINGQAFVELNLFKGFSWHTKLAGRMYSDIMKDWSGTPVPLYNYHTGEFSMYMNTGGGYIPGLQVNNQRLVFLNLYSYMKYNIPFQNKDHNLSVMAGYDQEEQQDEFVWAKRKYYNFNLPELNAGSESEMENDGNTESWSLMSGFFRLNYDYKDKYLIEINSRYDGTSRIARENRWGLFPSLSLGWRVTEEKFVQNLGLTWLDNAKIRGSWGQLGNQNIGLYPYQAVVDLTDNYSFDNSSLSPGVAQTAYAYRGIKWETTTITDLGLDMQLFRRLNLNFDLYKKSTTDILRSAQVSDFIGLNAPTINNGVMNNTGYEITVGWNDVIKTGLFNGLKYNLGFYIDHFKNKLVTFGKDEIQSNSILREGIPYNSYYMLDAIGIFADQNEIDHSPKQFSDDTKPGDIKYRDADKNGTIDYEDRVVIPGRFPKFNYSFNAGATWKGFDLALLFQGIEGKSTYINGGTVGWGITPFVQGSAPTKEYLDGMWTSEKPNGAKFPRLYYGDMGGIKNSRVSDFYLMNSSYLRLKNLVVGYTLPSALTQKFKIDRLRIYFSGDNLFTHTNFMGMDPERPNNSETLVTYPQNKVYSFGLNLEF